MMSQDRRSSRQVDDQLSAELLNLKREQFNLRFQAATNQLERRAASRKCAATSPDQDAADRARSLAPRSKEPDDAQAYPDREPWFPTRPTRPSS
jgi:hypothetical protein